MGEGWSDFVALQTYVRPTDLAVASNANWNGVYPIGAYALGGTPAALYYGIRRYPYSYDMTKDPLSFQHITEGSAAAGDATAGVRRQTACGNSEVHTVGEVWASTLWDCYVGILRDMSTHGIFDDALKTMRDYTVASYKATPVNPTILEARDALLLMRRDANCQARPRDLHARRSRDAAWASTPSGRRPARRRSTASSRARSPAWTWRSSAAASTTTCRRATTTASSTTARPAPSPCA